MILDTLIKPPEKGRKSYGDINGLSLRMHRLITKVGVFSIVLMVCIRLTLRNYPTLSLKDARQLTTKNSIVFIEAKILNMKRMKLKSIICLLR